MLADTRRNAGWLLKNAKFVNGTGGLLIIDIDPKNGGNAEALRRMIGDFPQTRTVRTVTPHPSGFGAHLYFTIPDDVAVAAERPLDAGIDVPSTAMLPGSVATGPDRVDREYTLVVDVGPAPPPLALLAMVD